MRFYLGATSEKKYLKILCCDPFLEYLQNNFPREPECDFEVNDKF